MALLAVASNANGDAADASADEALVEVRNLATEAVTSIDNSDVIGRLAELQELFTTNEERLAQLQFKLHQLLAEGRYLPEALRNRIDPGWLESIKASTGNIHGEMARATRVIEGMRTYSRGLSMMSAAENIAEGMDLWRIAGELGTAQTTTQEEALQQQALVDRILEQNARIKADGWAGLFNDVFINCIPERLRDPTQRVKHREIWDTLLTCAGLAFRNFARVYLNIGLQDASIKNRLGNAEENILNVLAFYAECGWKHAQSGIGPQFAGPHTEQINDPKCKNLAQRGIDTIETLKGRVDPVVRHIENRTFEHFCTGLLLWSDLEACVGFVVSRTVRALTKSQVAELRDAAALLQSDLANGEKSSVMGEWRAAYLDAYFATAWVLEMEKLGKQQEQSLRRLQDMAKEIGSLQRQAEALHAAVVAANEALAADLAAGEPEPEPEPANAHAADPRMASELVREWMPPACRPIIDDEWPRKSPDALSDHAKRLLRVSWRLRLADARVVTDQELRALVVDDAASQTFSKLQQAALTGLAGIEREILALIDFVQQRHEKHIAYLNTQFADAPIDGEARARLLAAKAVIDAVMARSRTVTARSRDYHRKELAQIQPRNARQIREFGHQVLVSEDWLRRFASQQQSCHAELHRSLVDTYNALGRSWSESMARRAEVPDDEQRRLARVQNRQYRDFLRSAPRIPVNSPRADRRWPATSSEWIWPTHKSLVHSLSDLLYLMIERAFLPESRACAAHRPTLTGFIRSLSPDPGFEWTVARTQLGARVRICIQQGSQ